MPPLQTAKGKIQQSLKKGPASEEIPEERGSVLRETRYRCRRIFPILRQRYLFPAVHLFRRSRIRG